MACTVGIPWHVLILYQRIPSVHVGIPRTFGIPTHTISTLCTPWYAYAEPLSICFFGGGGVEERGSGERGYRKLGFAYAVPGNGGGGGLPALAQWGRACSLVAPTLCFSTSPPHASSPMRYGSLSCRLLCAPSCSIWDDMAVRSWHRACNSSSHIGSSSGSSHSSSSNDSSHISSSSSS